MVAKMEITESLHETCGCQFFKKMMTFKNIKEKKMVKMFFLFLFRHICFALPKRKKNDIYKTVW